VSTRPHKVRRLDGRLGASGGDSVSVPRNMALPCPSAPPSACGAASGGRDLSAALPGRAPSGPVDRPAGTRLLHRAATRSKSAIGLSSLVPPASNGCYAQYVCVPERKLVPVPEGLDAAEAVAVVLNYITAYQMLHRSVKARPGQRMLIHGASGGVGSAMLKLAKLAGVEMFGTCSARGAAAVRELAGIPIDYKNADFVREIRRLTCDGVDAVFDAIGGDNLWRSRDALREGGRVVIYGFQSKMREGRIACGSGGRHRIRESAELGWFMVRNWFKPGRKSMVPYSIQWLMRLKPAWFRHDLLTLLDLLKQGKIKPLIAQRLPLEEARRAHEMLGEGGVLGKIVLVPNG
jgi:NADPH:quinone reductase-like Zn-dependent oxidoreductase